MERWADGEGRKILNDLGAWMAERVVEQQQTHFKASNVTIRHYKLGWDR